MRSRILKINKSIEAIRLNCAVGGGNPNPPPPQQVLLNTNIVNNVTDTCIKKMVDFSIKKDIQFTIDQSMNNLFQDNGKYVLTIQDGNITDPNTSGTNDLISRSPRQLGPGMVADQVNVLITLNKKPYQMRQENILQPQLFMRLSIPFWMLILVGLINIMIWLIIT